MKLLFVVFCFLFFNSLFAQNSNQTFRHLTVDQGLPHTDATGVLQDNHGFIWISTYSGLNRFDGYEIKNFISNNYQFQNVYLNRINSLFYNEEKIWLATQGGLAYFDCKKEDIIVPKFDKSLSNLNFSKVIVDKNTIYGISNGKLFAFEIIENQARSIKINAPNSFIITMAISPKGEMYLGTVKGLFAFKNNQAIPLKPENSISFIGFDNSQNILTGSNDGFGIFNTNTNTFSFHNFQGVLTEKNLTVASVVGDVEKGYWVGTTNGLLKFDTKTKQFSIPDISKSLSSSHVNHLLIDRSGSLWVSTFGGGINYVDLSPKKFQTLRFNESNYIRAIYEDDSDGSLWVGTRNNGLIHYDFKSKTQQLFSIKNGLSSNYIRSIIKDKKGRLWVGTENGISVIRAGKVIEKIVNVAQSPEILSNNVIYAMAVDVFGHVWAGSWHMGLNRIYETNGKTEIQKIYEGKNGLSSDKISYIYADPERPEVFIGTTKGLDHIYLNPDGSIAKIYHYLGKPNNEKSISSNFIWPILRTDIHTLWVGTIGGGLNKLTLKLNGDYSAETFNVKDGLPSNDVESLLVDNLGNIWMGGKGLSMFNPKTKQIINYDANDGLQSNIFKIGSACKGRDGKLYFGGVNGLNYFYPDQIKQSKFDSPIVLSDLLINNITAKISEDEIAESFPYLNQIKLNHLQNNLNIKFASLDFANSDKCKYRYKLIGFNEDWVEVDSKNRMASYSNLDYGTYTFQLQSTNHDGVWMKQTKEIKIEITPPWWKTIWAKLIYFVLISGILFTIYKYQISWLKLNNQLKIKDLEEKKSEELHQLRMQFFTNISHELRTPLSLIISPTEKLLHENVDALNSNRLFQLIHRNATRLLNLVNELLDFRKAEAGMMKLKANETHFASFLEDISSEFDEIANEKKIKFIKKLNKNNEKLWIDTNILGKIVVNLLSNAFKFTPENGEVSIELTDKVDLSFKNTYEEGDQNPSVEYQWIRVLDNGIGIDTDSLSHVFERFYRVTEAEKDKLPGSGIGLAYVKSLILIHKGIIKASSEPNKGTEFLLGIPKGKSHLNLDEMISSKDYSLDDSVIKAIETNQYLKEENQNNSILESDSNDKRKLKILVVEDNDELRHFLSDGFMANYHVIEAKDGLEGLEKAKEELPDLIVSDVMMPKMDGFELCKAIKTNIDISHTPFILLTAKNSDESRISGGEVAADSYITKPFSFKLLHLTIQNLIESRRRLKEMYANDIFIEAREMGTTKRDKEFIDFLINTIEEQLDNTDLDVEMICVKVGMSRTKLYNKIQSLTGQPVGEFIRKLRLKKAAQIIISEDVSITEVMERVGIQSQSYFTKAFKKEFGKTPTKFLHDFIVESEFKKMQ